MEATGLSLVTVVLFLPLIGFAIMLFMNERTQAGAIRWTALGFSVLTFLLSLGLWALYNPDDPGLQLVQRINWLPDYGISYYVGVDGLSLLLVILTTFIMPVAILASFRS